MEVLQCRRGGLSAVLLLGAFAGLIASGHLHAHTQTRSPGGCISSNIGGPNWGNAGRAVSSNNSYATVGVTDNENSDRLQCTGYGFSIPATATILGIIVNVERKASSASAPTQDFQMRVIKGGAVQATDRSTATAYTLVDTVEAHGGATDLWGTTWTPVDINAANFGAAFATFKNGTAGGNVNVTVDHIQVVVHYSQPPPVPTLVSPADASSTTNTQPTLDWTDEVDPDGDTVTYDIQADNSGCGFPSPEVDQTGLAVSTFTPAAPLAPGTYCWRVRTVDEHGVFSAWSTPRSITVAPLVIPSAFDAVEASAARSTPIRTKISGAGFSLDVLALDGSGNVLASYVGTVTVEIVDAASGAGVCAAMTSLQNLGSFTFTGAEAGRKSVAFNYPDATPNARIRVVDGGAGVTGCSFDNFAIRPASLTVSVTDADWTTAGGVRALDNTAASGGAVHKAGRPFRVTAVPQPGSVTQYAGSPTTSSAACLTLVGMTGCSDGALTVPAGGWSGTGTRVNDTVTYGEAGAFTLVLEDAAFASVDSADSSPAERIVPQTAAVQVGRFVPDRFAVAPANGPQFQTFGAACAGARSFTYVGQFFGYATTPVALVTAQNASGSTTTNYRDSLWKITTAAPSDVTQAYSNATGPALDVTQATNAPAVAAANNGTGTVTVSASDRIAHTRPAAPIAPFSADISLTITVRDDSEADGQITTTTATPFASIAFDSGAEFRFGRLAMTNANGSQLVPLAVPMDTQHWNGTSFVTNTADNCTTVAAGNVGLGNYSGLAAGDTTPSIAGAFSAGRKTLTLSAPGSTKSGTVDVVVNLNAAAGAFNSCVAFGAPAPSPAGADLPFLRGRWCGANHDRDATVRARFGVYKGAEEVIYIRENF